MSASGPDSAVPSEVRDPWHGFDPRNPEIKDDPYPALNRLRESAPVHRAPPGYYRVSRYVDVARLLKEVKSGVRTTDGKLPFTNESGFERTFMLQRDPPDHTRLRRLVSRAFSVPAINEMQAEIEVVVSRLVDAIEEKAEIDVIADLALPLPSEVICKMMGVPLADREKFTVWTAQATHGLLGELAEPDVQARFLNAALSLADYFDRLIKRRENDSGDDIVSVLVRAEADGDKLNERELLTQLIGLLIAGFETTIGLIGNGVRQLLIHGEELEKLRRRPELIDRAVEECLRFDGPILATRRVVHEDIFIGGLSIPKNSTVDVLLGAAHRDPAVFHDPDRFNVERDPNPHFAFGGGIHYCLGAQLARVEARAAIGALVKRLPRMRLVSHKVEWGPSIFRVPARLPVMLG
jgi:cytochrome P450